jgi:hypothetical protein
LSFASTIGVAGLVALGVGDALDQAVVVVVVGGDAGRVAAEQVLALRRGEVAVGVVGVGRFSLVVDLGDGVGGHRFGDRRHP